MTQWYTFIRSEKYEACQNDINVIIKDSLKFYLSERVMYIVNTTKSELLFTFRSIYNSKKQDE